MITSINNKNREQYQALFNDAADILAGYKRTRTYEIDGDNTVYDGKYYIKNIEAKEAKDLFFLVPVDADRGDEVEAFDIEEAGVINSLTQFAKVLQHYKNLVYRKLKERPSGAEAFDPIAGITTLEEYFSWLGTLSGQDKKYTVLPLDEPHFEIDTNTRAIKIPAEFKKNGVAVQGDDLAEVLYFKVPRYFDYMDLDTCDIFIQWELPKGVVAEGQPTKYVSPAYLKDIESDPGYLIFGWVLTDEITANAGNLKFSVRFFKWDDKDGADAGANKVLTYSLSTLIATVTIQPSINFNLSKEYGTYELDDAGARLLQRIDNSDIAGGYIAAYPIFAEGVDPFGNSYDLDDEKEYDLPKDNTLSVIAYADDTGSITYTWKHLMLDENNSTEKQRIQYPVATNKYVGFTGKELATLDPKYAYFEKRGDYYEQIQRTIPITSEEDQKSLILYQKWSSIEPKEAGIYFAVAQNRITNSASSTNSKKAHYWRPLSPANLPEGQSIVWPVNGVLKGGKYTLQVTAPEQANQTKTYQWYKYNNSEKDFAPSGEPILISGATGASFDATTPGHYGVTITNSRNRYDISVTSDFVRVTPQAEKPIIDVDASFAVKGFAENTLTDSYCPTMVVKTKKNGDTILSDYYVATWYHRTGVVELDDEGNPVSATTGKDIVVTQVESTNADTSLVNVDADGNLVFKFNPSKFKEIITASSADQDLEGIYYAVITNVLNDTTENALTVEEVNTSAPSEEDFKNLTNCYFVTA